MKRAALIAVGGLIGLYLLVLVFGGWVLSGCVESRIEERIAAALAADVDAADVFGQHGNGQGRDQIALDQA